MKKKTSSQSFGLKKLLKWGCFVGASCAVIGAAVGLVAFSVVYYQLPSIETLTEYRPKVPLRVYTADGDLIGEFGEERRDFVPIEEMHTRASNLWGLLVQH